MGPVQIWLFSIYKIVNFWLIDILAHLGAVEFVDVKKSNRDNCVFPGIVKMAQHF